MPKGGMTLDKVLRSPQGKERCSAAQLHQEGGGGGVGGGNGGGGGNSIVFLLNFLIHSAFSMTSHSHGQ